jgi:hypothetical protein
MTEPPFWWMGLFASVGGLLIVGLSMTVLILALLLVRCHLMQRRDEHDGGSR